MKKTTIKTTKRARRHGRIRARIQGTAERPRLSIHKSNTALTVQVIDDMRGITLVSCSDRSLKGKTKTLRAEEAGRTIARLAKEKGVTKVAFDRGGFLYAGRVKAIAEGARAEGLMF